MKSKLSPNSDFRLSPQSVDLISELKTLQKDKTDFIIKILGDSITVTIGNDTIALENIDGILPCIKKSKINNNE